MITVNCYTCGKEKEVEAYRLKKTARFFCSKQCQYQWQRTEEYKQIHYKQDKYDEIECSFCKRAFSRRKSLINGGRNFCNVVCRNKFMSEFNNIYNPNPSKDYIKTQCQECNYPLAVPESVYRKNIHGHFCTQDCYWEWKSKNLHGENNPHYSRITVNCNNCMKGISITKFEQKRNKHNFCSPTCYSEFRSKFYVGENSYWLGKKRPELASLSRSRMLKMISEGKVKKISLPHKKVIEMLEELNISYETEEVIGYYSVDIFIKELNLFIEVMGDYWHGNPLKYKLKELNKVQLKDINRDKRKQTYIKKYKGVEILYLWEEDINKRTLLCKRLIRDYINKKGMLKNYQSYNYSLNEEGLSLNKIIVEPLWENKL